MTQKHLVFLAGILYVVGISSIHTVSASPSFIDKGEPIPAYLNVFQLDTIPLEDRKGNFLTSPNRNPFDLKDPSNV
ncbi:MAG TPA: hypothetical protein VJ951_12805, partial [Bacteroidales bacterium]|nr:hypothetical protein [Bacteroidales bacterium]